jgi:hypothetical protein
MFQTTRLMCVLALGVIALRAQTVPVETIETTRMIGIAYGQTARLNLLNPSAVTPVAAAAVPCTASVQYLDASGTVLKTATVTVAPGVSVPVDLHSDSDLSLAVNGRREIRAIIAVPLISLTPLVPPPPSEAAGATPTPTPTSTPACTLLPTLEIFDTLTGRTEALLGRADTID